MPTAFRHSHSTFVCHFLLFNTTVARHMFLLASSGAPECASFRSNLCFIDKRPLRRLFSSPLKRGTAVSCAEPPHGKPDSLLRRRLPSPEGAGLESSRERVKGDKIDDEVRWKPEERLDPLALEPVELYKELQLAVASTNEGSIVQEEGACVEHLTPDVYVQYGAQALDIDTIGGKRDTITGGMSKLCSTRTGCITKSLRVAVTGQSGIGKTRRSMMYAI
eukprot:GFKZ01012114.1.p1 GENE.GFKZ01012114.1~~GFKZ01012114.1.p1  ORF type:complete len:220 (+),score=17.31 GFKZ01012114.1:2-661(+)